jgi:hypothetical protein
MGNFTDANGVFRLTRKGRIALSLSCFWLAGGTPLAAFANGASTTPGLALDNAKAAGVRWNNHATPDEIYTSFLAPSDRRPGTDLVVKIRASKSGATAGDAVVFTIQAFNQVDGALSDADTDFGGDSSAMTGNAAAKTVQLVSRALASADISDGSAITMSFQPKDGTLGTDDVTVHQIWVEYEQIFTVLPSE